MELSKKKEARYDRQLRLWGNEGQIALEGTHVGVINGCATATEMLKSLVLPGIGAFTVIDHQQIQPHDTGSNFFVTTDDIGQSRAKVVTQYLQELNEEVHGNYVDVDVEKALESGNLKFLNGLTAVVACGVTDKLAAALDEILWTRDIPFLYVKTYGAIGSIRVSMRESFVIESHPDNPAPDLRLDRPFPAFQSLCDSIDLSTLNHQKHSHTPYAVLLLKAIERWRKDQEGKENDDQEKSPSFPISYSQKKEIKKLLNDMQMPDDKGRFDEENFQEAINVANRTIRVSSVPSNVQKIFDAVNEGKANFDGKNGQYWLLAMALNKFVQEHGALPVSGALPDMISDSEMYIKLLHAFHDQAKEDVQKFKKILMEILTSRGLNETHIPDGLINKFCRHASDLWISTDNCSLHNEIRQPSAEKIKNYLSSNPSHTAWYICLRATDKFSAEKDRYPGTNGIPVQLDRIDLMNRVKNFANEISLASEIMEVVTEDHMKEMCRYGACEPHVIATWIGSIASQELIKAITRQYIPLNNTIIFDLFTHSCSQFTF